MPRAAMLEWCAAPSGPMSSSGRQSTRRRPVLLLALASCSGEALVIGEERARPGDSELEPVGIVNAAAPGPDVALLLDCPPSPEERRAAPGCWPVRHLGHWRGFFVGVPRYQTLDGTGAEFPTGDVLLMLGIDGAGQLLFGAPQTGWPVTVGPLLPPCEPRERGPGCSAPGLLIPSYSYRIERLELRDRELGPEPRIPGEPLPTLGERVSFRVRAGEPWDGWCADHEAARGACAGGDCPGGARPAAYATNDASAPQSDLAGCRCSPTECVSEAPALWIDLRMSEDGDALRGAYTPNDPALGEARLEFVRDSGP